jgi:hypothetical protein
VKYTSRVVDTVSHPRLTLHTDQPHSTVRHVLISVCIVALSVTVAALFRHELDVVLGLTGAVGGSLVVYVFPAMLYAAYNRRVKETNTSAVVLGVFRVLTMVSCVIVITASALGG